MSLGRRKKRWLCAGLASVLFLLTTPVFGADSPLHAAVSVHLDQAAEQTLSGALNGGHQTELYRLDVKQSGTLRHKLTFSLAALDVRLLNQDGQVIKTWYQRRDETLRTGSGEIRFSVEPGTYYIQLKRRSGDGNYQLTQSFDEEKTTELQPNDTLEQAQPLALGDTAYGVIGIGYARNSRDKDVYRLEIPAAKNITFTLNSALSGAYLHLYDAQGEQIKYAFAMTDKNTGRNQIRRTYKLAAGIYYLLVKGGSDTGAYTLKAAAAVPPAKTAIKSLVRRSQYQNLQINLKKVKGAEGYQIYIGEDAGFKKVQRYRKTKLTSSYHLAKGKTYYVKARAYRKNSEGGYIYGGFSKVKKIRL